MHTNLLLETLIAGVLQEISKQGLCDELNCQYRRIYNRFKKFAKCRNQDSYTTNLADSFLEDINRRFEIGVIGRCRRNHLRRASLLLKEYVETGTIEWKVYSVGLQPMPSSPEFFLLYSQFIDNLKSLGRSDNTIQSARNLIRQFLLFLEDNGCRTLSMTPLNMIPSFFQHLLSTYKPTSIRTVASHIRTFLSFTEERERLMPLVPLNCVRNKPIIPVLSDKEHDLLKIALQSKKLLLRDKAIIKLALRTGLRAVDILGIKLEDIDWVNDSISIVQSKTKNPFTIPLTADVGNVLSAYILNERPQKDTSYVFLRSRAPFRPLSGHAACYAILRNVFHQAGIRLGDERKGLHILRHSAASRMLSKGIPVTTISSMLGHSSKESTDVYLATDEKHMRECSLSLTMIPMNCRGLK